MNGCVQTRTFEFHDGRWVATSGIIVNRHLNQWSNFGGTVLYRRRYVPIGAEL
jgi:hypothetical protein